MNVAVIGSGWWGKNIINSFEEIETIKNVFVYDIQSNAYSRFVNNKKLKIAINLEQILHDSSIQAVCVATPPQTHYEICKIILQHGKNVLTEKPPAYKSAQVSELGRIASDKNLIYMLDALYLFLEPIRELKKIISSGVLSNIKFVQVYRIGDELRRLGAGIERIEKVMFDNNTDVLEDLFFHDAGILLYLFENMEYSSCDKLYFYNDNLCDTARIRLSHGNIPIELNLSWILTGRKRGITIYDSNYIIEYDGLKEVNQISKFSLRDMKNEIITFQNIPPLKTMLEFYIETINEPQKNFLDSIFMNKVMTLWDKIRNGK